MRSKFHSFSEGVSIDAEAYGAHFGGSEAGIHHVEAPFVHFFLPFRELIRISLWNSIGVGSLSNFPEETPFGVMCGWLDRLDSIFA